MNRVCNKWLVIYPGLTSLPYFFLPFSWRFDRAWRGVGDILRGWWNGSNVAAVLADIRLQG